MRSLANAFSPHGVASWKVRVAKEFGKVPACLCEPKVEQLATP